MRCVLMSAMLSLALGAATGVAAEPQAPRPAPDAPGYFPLGVYWPGEWTCRAADGGQDWPKNEALLDNLAAHHVNVIWLTHTDAANTAEFARRSAKRGIFLVASLGELDGNVPQARTTDYAKQIAGVLKAWGDAPKPIAWGLCDEPRTATMHEMAPYTKAWTGAGQPVTTVVMAGDIPAAAKLLKAKFLCTDIYPFFSAGNPNGPDTMGESASYVAESGRRVRQMCRENGMGYWFMGAAFQEPWGPRILSEKGDFVYLPGGNAHFRMPTVGEVRWQNWAALATGARGVVLFSLFFNMTADPQGKPIEAGFGLKEKTDSGAPGGLLYPDGRPTRQYEAMGESFARIARVAAILNQVEPTQELTVFHSKGWIPPGDVVQPFRDKQGNLYAIVVNGETEKEGTVAVNVPAETAKVTDLVSGQVLDLIKSPKYEWEPIGAPFKQARVVLPAGEGTLLKVESSSAAAK
jgi:hypothetical protein